MHEGEIACRHADLSRLQVDEGKKNGNEGETSVLLAQGGY